MPAQPCANHPKEMTFVRCGRCDKPICVQCMVDTPVGKKCRDCARNRTHVTESSAKQVIPAFLAAVATAIPAGLLVQAIPLIILPAVVYGYVIAQVALWAGQRRRSLAMQVAAGAAALIGGLPAILMAALFLFARPAEGVPPALQTQLSISFGISLMNVIIGIVVAVSRVRYL